MSGTIAEAVMKSASYVSMMWTAHCETILKLAGANTKDWILVVQDVTGGGRNAWAQPQNEPTRPRYPMVQMRMTDGSVTVRIVVGLKVERGQCWRHVPSGDERTVVDVVPYYVAAGCRSESDVDTHHRDVNVARMARVRGSDGCVSRDRRDSSDMILNARGEPMYAAEWTPMPSSEETAQ